jgi:hypothetical protein
MAQVSLETLRLVFDDRVISSGLWPPRSPDMTPCDVYLWGRLKYKAYKINPHSGRTKTQHLP